MSKYFPLGCFRDRSAEVEEFVPEYAPVHDPEEVKAILFPRKLNIGVSADFRNESDIFRSERRIKIAGFGGQGILSLGIMLATMGKLRTFNVSWLPSYGPEQRGGSANCSVILSREKIASPIIDGECNLLIAMTSTALEKFKGELKPNSVLVYDSSTLERPDVPADIKVLGIDALNIAREIGNVLNIAGDIIVCEYDGIALLAQCCNFFCKCQHGSFPCIVYGFPVIYSLKR